MITMYKKIFSVLTKKDKKALIPIVIVILINGLLELVGVSLIMPVITLLINGEAVIEANFILRVCSLFFQTRETGRLAIAVLVLLVVFYVIRTTFALFHTYVTSRFAQNYSRRLTRRLMEAYLSFPYEYHLNHNSSLLIRKSTYDSTNFTTAITGSMSLLSTFVTVVLISAYLIYTDYRIALIVGALLALFSLIVTFVLKPHIKKVAKRIQKYNSENYKYLSQAFNGIKESKIGNSEEFFTDIYDENRKKINDLTVRNAVYNAIPRQAIEFVGLLGVALSLSIIILVGSDSNAQIVETFAVFVYAVIKLLPSVSNIAGELGHMQFYKVSVDSLSADLEEAKSFEPIRDESETYPLPFEDSIRLENVSFYYSLSPDKKILSNVNLEIKKNSSVAISGASGAGKTTTIDLILGLLPCREGAVMVDGVNIESNMRGWRTNIAYVPQTIFLSDDSIRNNIAFGVRKENINDNLIWDCLEKAQLKEYVESLPDGLNTVIGERGIRMSGGQRQRVGIARAFYRNTNVIVLDEATSALDYETEKSILDHISKVAVNHTLIIITHRLNTIEGCDHIFKVESGTVTQMK